MHGYQRNPIDYPLTQLGQKPDYLKLQARLSKALPSNISQHLDFESCKTLINAPNNPHGYAALDLNGDGQLQEDEFLYFSNGKSHITPMDMAKMLVKLDAQDGTLDGRIKRSSLDAAAEEAKGYFCQLDTEAVKKLPNLDAQNIAILRDHLYKAKRSIYATDGNYDPSQQGSLNKTNDLTILKTILQEAAQASQASIRAELKHASPGILASEASQWSPALQKKWMAKFMTYLNEIFLGGRIPLLPKASNPSINLSDSGHSYRIRDRTENQTFHTLALVAIGYYLGGTMAKAANIFHETLDPMDMINGKSAEDYRASDVGLKLGTLLRHGKMTPDTF
ncbi:MAG: hypothetical protein K2X66_15850, partial [Cyanobacteria bacterium]|nr:hypothetical protein [Cyanobacteriota bacterium]